MMLYEEVHLPTCVLVIWVYVHTLLMHVYFVSYIFTLIYPLSLYILSMNNISLLQYTIIVTSTIIFEPTSNLLLNISQPLFFNCIIYKLIINIFINPQSNLLRII